MSRPVSIQGTEDVIPSGNTGASNVTITNATNAYHDHTWSSNYATLQLTSSNTSTVCYAYFTFNTSAVPADATITSVTAIVKAYRNNRVTQNTAGVQLYANTTAKGTAVAGTLGTSATTVNITNGGSWTRSELNNLRIRLYGVRNSTNANRIGYLYLYGATVTINYTVSGTEYEVTINNQSSDVTTDPSTTQYIFQGDSQDISFFGIESLNDVDIKDNNTNIESQLVHVTSRTSSFIPSSLDSSSGNVTNPDNGLTDETSTTYAQTNGQSTHYLMYKFDTSSIPQDAVINSVSCVAKVQHTRTSSSSGRVQLYSGNSTKGTESTFGNTTTTINLTTGTWTREELNDVKIRIGNNYTGGTTTYNTRFYGATLSVSYSTDVYTYTISNISADHTILIEDTGTLYNVSASSSYSGATITPTSKQVREGRDITFTITTQNLTAIKLVDNNVDVTSSIVGSSGSYTYTIQNISGDHTLVLSEKPQYTIAVSSDYSIASLQTSAGTVYEGQSATITLTTSDLSTTDVFDNSVSIISSFTGSGTTYTYTLSNISESHILVATEKATVKLFIKTNGTYLRAKKIFKNINGVWTEINLESLTDHNVYIYGGVITTDHDEIGTVSHTGDDILIEINDNALSSGTYTLRYDDATRTPIENIDEITTFTIS